MSFIRIILISFVLILNNNLLGSEVPMSPRATSHDSVASSGLEVLPDLDPVTSLEVFNSSYGLGLRAKVKIPKGSCLGAYTGLRVSEAEYHKVEFYRAHLNGTLKKYLGSWYPQTNFIYPSQRYYFDLKRGGSSVVVVDGTPNPTLKAIAQKNLRGDDLSSADVEYLRTVHFPWKVEGRIKFPQTPSLLSFVNTNGVDEEANVAAVQYHKKNTYFICFVATKEIQVGDEILVDYGAAYKKLLFTGASSAIEPHHQVLLDLIDQGILQYHDRLMACITYSSKKGFKLNSSHKHILERILFEVIHTTSDPNVQSLLETEDLKRIKARRNWSSHGLFLATSASGEEGRKEQSPASITAARRAFFPSMSNNFVTCSSSSTISSSNCTVSSSNCTVANAKSSSSASAQVTPCSARSLDSEIEKAFCDYEEVFGSFINWTCPLPSCQKSKCNRKELFAHFLRRHLDMTDLSLIMAAQKRACVKRSRKPSIASLKVHVPSGSGDSHSCLSLCSTKRSHSCCKLSGVDTKRLKSPVVKASKARKKKTQPKDSLQSPTDQISAVRSSGNQEAEVDPRVTLLDSLLEDLPRSLRLVCPVCSSMRRNHKDLVSHFERKHY